MRAPCVQRKNEPDYIPAQSEPTSWLRDRPSPEAWIAEYNQGLRKKMAPWKPRIQNAGAGETADWPERFKGAAREAANEALMEGWNGPRTRAVRRDALDRIEPLSRLLPNTLPIPDVSVSPFGSLAFDWAFRNDLLLTISLTENNSVSFSLTVGELALRGRSPFDPSSLPDDIVGGIERLQRAAASVLV